MYFFYDGSFLGFLSLVYEVFLINNFDIFILKLSEKGIFDGNSVDTNEENAYKVYSKLVSSLGRERVDKIFTCFLSNEDNIEVHLIKYIRQALKYGKNIDKYFFPEVKKVEDIFKTVTREAHKFKGFIRFRKLKDNTYISIICPDNNILPVIKDHFIDRFNDQNFVIYDEKRKVALIFDSSSKNNKIIPINEFDKRLKNHSNTELLHSEELEYTSLWKSYFSSINIEERVNKKLQSQHVPKKYRDNLIEFP